MLKQCFVNGVSKKNDIDRGTDLLFIIVYLADAKGFKTLSKFAY